ncbi:MAG: nucleotidyltransferase domain-containing protein [archaeon GB-1867-035]|nr:nucleotidyltransferase domain-containing protein [Candidatus Culexmicrobium profundum]
MSHKILVKEAIRSQEAFKNLEKHLETIKQTVKEIDSKAEIYLFGSIAEKTHTYSSDIDILIITKENPSQIHLKLWKAGIKPPFEIHIQPPEKLELYKKRAKLIKIQ